MTLPAIVVIDHPVNINFVAEFSHETDGKPTRAEITSRSIPDGEKAEISGMGGIGLKFELWAAT